MTCRLTEVETQGVLCASNSEGGSLTGVLGPYTGSALSGCAIALTATEKAKDAISVSGLNLTVTDANGTLSTAVFLAVPAGAKIAKVSLPMAKEPEMMPKPSTTPQEGVDYVTIGGAKWAKWNVGASSETEFGWYFQWGGTEGYVRYLKYADT